MTEIALPGLWLPPKKSVVTVRTKPWWLIRAKRANVLAAIGTPTSIGTLAQSALAGSIVLPVAASVAAGQKVLIAVGGASFSGTTVTISDTGTNTWNVDAANVGGATGSALASSQITTPLTTSDTITATFSAGVTSRLIAGVQVSGLATAALDKIVTAGGTTLAWSSGATATTTLADELVVGVCANDSTTTETSTPDSPYLELFDFVNTSATEMTVIYQIVSATGAYTGSGVWTNSGTRSWAAITATYKSATITTGLLPGIDFSLFPKPKLVKIT